MRSGSSIPVVGGPTRAVDRGERPRDAPLRGRSLAGTDVVKAPLDPRREAREEAVDGIGRLLARRAGGRGGGRRRRGGGGGWRGGGRWVGPPGRGTARSPGRGPRLVRRPPSGAARRTAS